MKIFSFYTPSYKILYDSYFKPSLLSCFESVPYCYEKQLCKESKFQEEGWAETQKEKLKYWISSIKDNIGENIICSDVDVQFLKWDNNFVERSLGDKDIVFQNNRYEEQPICSGFFICKSSNKIIDLFEKVIEKIDGDKIRGEQSPLNDFFIKEKTFTDISWGFLPSDKIWCPGIEYAKHKTYSVPQFLYVHHANWEIGINNKIKQLEDVRNKFKLNIV